MKRSLLAYFSLLIAACASSPDPEPRIDVPRFDRSQTSLGSGYTQSTETSSASSRAGEVYAHNDTSKESPNEVSGLEAVEAPTAPETPPELIPGRPEPQSAIVCERMVPTGSILPVKVCRDRAEMERRERYDQRMIDDIKRNTANGASRL